MCLKNINLKDTTVTNKLWMIKMLNYYREGNYELKEKIRIKERTLEEQKMLDHSLRCC